MPRTARKVSPTGIYHVMLRGVNQQQIFYNDEDFECFLRVLERYKTICGFILYAYCLMGNHIHLLIKPEMEPLETIFRRIGSSFVYRYNQKYDRVGHLFQSRFMSVVVDSEQYFIKVLQYILQNPVKAGLCDKPEQYRYSSAKEYVFGMQGITDTKFALELMNREEWIEFLHEKTEDNTFFEMTERPRKRCTDRLAKELILEEFGSYSPKIEGKEGREKLRESLQRLILQGISIKQLKRLTGLPADVIQDSMLGL